MSLTREQIQSGWVQKMAQEAGHSMKVLTEEELAQSRRETMACAPSKDVWVFGYGSLMWSPGFRPAESSPALLRGYHDEGDPWKEERYA